MGIAALIVAAGRGKRAGGGLPKQYRPLGGRMVLSRTLAAFAAHPRIDSILAVIHPDDHDLYDSAARGCAKALAPVAGGAERQDSARAGLRVLAAQGVDKVLIHDAARPFVGAAVIDRVIKALDDSPGALAALPLADALWRGEAGACAEPVPRAGLWRAQTPQGFWLKEILAAHEAAAGLALADDADVARRAGLRVALVEGAPENLKLTTPADFIWAENWLKDMDLRIGQGFDVHRFCAGDHATLGGVRIPHDQGVEAHSDGDVALHALTDAILGALALGDIGQHFPPSEARWKGAASGLFVAHAIALARAEGWRLNNADLTIVCERPKVMPHAPAMRANIAALCGVEESRISIKATTSEKLGFTGRREGLCAFASVTMMRGA